MQIKIFTTYVYFYYAYNTKHTQPGSKLPVAAVVIDMVSDIPFPALLIATTVML